MTIARVSATFAAQNTNWERFRRGFHHGFYFIWHVIKDWFTVLGHYSAAGGIGFVLGSLALIALIALIVLIIRAIASI